jgi:hypothetical protein
MNRTKPASSPALTQGARLADPLSQVGKPPLKKFGIADGRSRIIVEDVQTFRPEDTPDDFLKAIRTEIAYADMTEGGERTVNRTVTRPVSRSLYPVPRIAGTTLGS